MDTNSDKELIKLFSSINDKDTMAAFFSEIFTEAERKNLSLRWQLMKMLHKNIPQREIASILGVSLCKITRGAKIIKDKNSVTRQVLDKNQVTL